MYGRFVKEQQKLLYRVSTENNSTEFISEVQCEDK